MAFSALAAVAEAVGIATTAAEIASAVAIVGEVGAVMGVVGAVTGNQDLMKIGGALGLMVGASALTGAAATAAAAEGTAAGALGGGAADAAANLAQEQATSGSALSDKLLPVEPPVGVPDAGPVTGAPQTPVQPVSMNNPSAYVAPASEAPVTGTPAMEGGPTTGVDAAQSNVSAASNRADTLAPTGPQGPNSPAVNGAGQRVNNPSAYVPANYNPDGSPIKKVGGSFFDWLTSDGNDRTKAQIIGALASIPGGMQQAQLAQQNLALQQQKVNQTSHGSEVPRFTTLNAAMR